MRKFADMETSPDDMELHETKAEVYETWAGINRAFEQIISAVGKLHKLGVLSDDYVQDQETVTNDLWAKVNTQILKKVSEREEDDRNHYGKMRATIERRIEAGNSLSFCGREPGQLWIGASFHVCLCIDCVRIPLLYSFPGRSSSRKRSAKNSWAYRPGKNLYL